MQKSNLALQEKHESGKKYLKQMTSLLEIKANRLKEEEIILKAEKEGIFNQKDELQRKVERFNRKSQKKIKELQMVQKDYEEKMGKVEGFQQEFKFQKKNLKNKIKDKMMEKFALRENIILRSQQELKAKEEQFSQKYLEKKSGLAIKEEILKEWESRLEKLEENYILEKDKRDFSAKDFENEDVKNFRFLEKVKGFEVEEKKLGEEIKRLKLISDEKDEVIKQLSLDLASKSDIQSQNTEISNLQTELLQKFQLLIIKENEIQKKEESLLDLATFLESKENFLRDLEMNLSQLSHTLNTQRSELEALSCSLNKQSLAQTMKNSEIENIFESISKHQTELIEKSEKNSEKEFLMKHLQTLLEKKKILLESKESILKSLRM
jgi:chromosome segregation protein